VTTDAVKLAPSILAADFAHLGDQVEEAERAGADRIHVDVMDGHFVPNLSMGPPIIDSLRRVTHLPLEAHLMISNPDCKCRPQRLRIFRFTAVLGAGGFLWGRMQQRDLIFCGSTMAGNKNLENLSNQDPS